MSELMKTPVIKRVLEVTVCGDVPVKFVIARHNAPKLFALLRRLHMRDRDETMFPSCEVFNDLDKKYGKVGATVRGLRLRDGFTQKELAQKLRIYQVHVSQIEHGKRIIGKNLAHKLARMFQTDYRIFL